MRARERESVFVCMCVCVQKMERERVRIRVKKCCREKKHSNREGMKGRGKCEMLSFCSFHGTCLPFLPLTQNRIHFLTKLIKRRLLGLMVFIKCGLYECLAKTFFRIYFGLVKNIRKNIYCVLNEIS